MSPVSRGRKKKRPSKRAVKDTAGAQRTNMQHAAPATLESPLERLLQPRERPAWFEASITRVLENASALPAARGPRELEQLTAELLGAELHRAAHEEDEGSGSTGGLQNSSTRPPRGSSRKPSGSRRSGSCTA
jgi:hypothetical protein